MTRPLTLLAALLLVAPVILATSANDAGTGADAGNTPATALALPGTGTFHGRVDTASDDDWYSLSNPTTDPVCVSTTAGSNAHKDVRLRDGPSGLETVRRVDPDHNLSLGLARHDMPTTFLGFDDDNGAAGKYVFTMARLLPSAVDGGDGGTTQDAGSSVNTSIPVPGPCFGGTLQASGGILDKRDTYRFDGEAGEPITLSLAITTNAPVTLALTSPSGETILTLATGAVEEVNLTETGVWSLGLSIPLSSTDVVSTTYLVGLTDGPNPNPCRPTCLE